VCSTAVRTCVQIIIDRVSTGEGVMQPLPSACFHSISFGLTVFGLDLLHVCRSLPWLAEDSSWRSQVRVWPRSSSDHPDVKIKNHGL